MSDKMIGPGTYLTDAEAKELHKGFVVSMAFFVFVALIAHFLVWMWRPWLGAPKAMASAEIVQMADATRAVPTRG